MKRVLEVLIIVAAILATPFVYEWAKGIADRQPVIRVPSSYAVPTPAPLIVVEPVQPVEPAPVYVAPVEQPAVIMVTATPGPTLNEYIGQTAGGNPFVP